MSTRAAEALRRPPGTRQREEEARMRENPLLFHSSFRRKPESRNCPPERAVLDPGSSPGGFPRTTSGKDFYNGWRNLKHLCLHDLPLWGRLSSLPVRAFGRTVPRRTRDYRSFPDQCHCEE